MTVRVRWVVEDRGYTTPCHVSTLSTDHNGYAQERREGRLVYCHRVAWEEVHGPVPDGLCVLHRCDVRLCRNVDHLFLGTRGDNNRDMAEKGRQWQQRKTHCVHGHEFTLENTMPNVEPHRRRCRTCKRERERDRKRRRRAEGRL